MVEDEQIICPVCFGKGRIDLQMFIVLKELIYPRHYNNTICVVTRWDGTNLNSYFDGSGRY